MRTIYLCKNCGYGMEGTDKVVKNYCGDCKTAEGRKKMEVENELIKQNREKNTAQENWKNRQGKHICGKEMPAVTDRQQNPILRDKT